MGQLEAALSRGVAQHGAADLVSWSSLWLACVCPISQCSGALVRRHGVWRPRPLRSGFLRPWVRVGIFAVWLWERGILWCVPTGPIRLSRGRKAGLRRKAGCLWPHGSGECPEASRSGSPESGLPPRLAKGLVSGLSSSRHHAPTAKVMPSRHRPSPIPARTCGSSRAWDQRLLTRSP